MKTGRCLCGAVTFEADGVANEFQACHCAMCRRWSGGAPFFSAYADAVRFSGEAALGRFASSARAERGFCKACGTILFYRFRATGRYELSVGAFDDPSAFVLTQEIFVDQKPTSYALAGDHPRLTESEALAENA